MKVYLCDRDPSFIDTVQFYHDLQGAVEPAARLEDADVYVVLSGQYLMAGYKTVIEEEIDRAKRLGKPVYVLSPHGSAYIPVALRGVADRHADFVKDAMEALFR